MSGSIRPVVISLALALLVAGAAAAQQFNRGRAMEVRLATMTLIPTAYPSGEKCWKKS